MAKMSHIVQLQTAVANIQQELKRISSLSDRISNSSDPKDEGFRNQLIEEFNGKLRVFKKKNRLLKEENMNLQKRIKDLEGELAMLRRVPDLKLPANNLFVVPSKRKRQDEGLILSSPIKKSDGSRSPERNETLSDLTSSQFNMLPTQYSEASSLPKKRTELSTFEDNGVRDLRKDTREEDEENYQIKRESGQESDGLDVSEVISDLDQIIPDSQDELEPLDANDQDNYLNNETNRPRGEHLTTSDKEKPYPKHYTALQRIQFLRTYYRMKIKDKTYRVDFSKNPITEKMWAADDFVRNPDWVAPKKLNLKLSSMTNKQQHTYQSFFLHAGYGVEPLNGPRWMDRKQETTNEELVMSQIMDKYLSPPGYMTGDFVSTQEAHEKLEKVKERERERVQRRVASALSKGEFIFYEEILNTVVDSKQYVRCP